MRRFQFFLFFSLILTNQPSFSQEILDGKLLYADEAGCASCHGLDGKGEVEGLTLDPAPPDFTDCSFNSREPRKDWQAVIKHGGVARGLSESMPAYEEALSDAQINAIIDYIKTFCTESDWPSGELNFRRPQTTGKAFPENETLLIPTFTKKQNHSFVTKFVYEKRWGKLAQWEVAVPFQHGGKTSSASGVGNIELSVKRVLSHNPQTSTIFSGGIETSLPSGKSAIGIGEGEWKIAPYLAGAKGLGTFFVQSNLKYETPLKSHKGERELFLNLAFTYAMTKEKKGLFPMLEFNGVKNFSAEEKTLLLTPQLYIGLVKRGHIAFSIGSQIPVAGERPFDYRVVSFLLWEYADGGLWW